MWPGRGGTFEVARLGYVVALLFLALAAAEGWFVLSTALSHSGTIGLDFTMYQDRTRDFLAGEGFYRARQLAGPYLIEAGDALYPPSLLLLMVPFALGLPAPLWWMVPLGVIAAAIVAVRPPWWPLLVVILVYPRTWANLLYGNPSLWAFAAIAAGMAWRWPAVLAVLKPTLGLFALVGIRDRRWWVTLAVAAVVSLPFGALWFDYLRVLRDASAAALGPDYLAGDLPIALLLVAGLAKRP